MLQLAVWKVDEEGDNKYEDMTPKRHYECALVQADGRFDLEQTQDHLGDASDLFAAPGATVFGANTKPAAKWWDGHAAGLELHDIEKSATRMKFKARLT